MIIKNDDDTYDLWEQIREAMLARGMDGPEALMLPSGGVLVMLETETLEGLYELLAARGVAAAEIEKLKDTDAIVNGNVLRAVWDASGGRWSPPH